MKLKSIVPIVAVAFVSLLLLFHRAPNITPNKPIPENKAYAGEKIRFLVSDPQIVAARYLAERFQEETGAVVEIVNVPYPELAQKIIEHHHTDSANVDVVMFWYLHLGQLVEENMLVDLTEFIGTHRDILQPEDFISSVYDAYTLYKKRRWGLPFDGDTHAMFYNTSIFERYGLSPPQTWDEYLKLSTLISEKEKVNGIYGNAIMAEPVPVVIISVFMNRLNSYGGKLLDEHNMPLLDSPEALAALRDMIEQSKSALPTPVETDFNVCVDAFLSGQVAMIEQWTDIGIMAEDERKSRIKGQWGVIPIPARDKEQPHVLSLNAGHTLALSTKSQNRKLAEAFLLFASTPSMCLELNLIKGGSGIDPVRFSVLASQEFTEFAPQISELERNWLPDAKAWPTIPQMPDMTEIFARNLRFALEGTLTPENVLDETNQQWKQLLSE